MEITALPNGALRNRSSVPSDLPFQVNQRLFRVPFPVFSPTDALSGTALRYRHLTARTFGVMVSRQGVRGAPFTTGVEDHSPVA